MTENTLAAKLELADWKHAAQQALNEADGAIAGDDYAAARKAVGRALDALARCGHLASAFREAA